MEKIRNSIVVIVFFIILISIVYVFNECIMTLSYNLRLNYTKYVYLGGNDITVYINHNTISNPNEVSNTGISAASGILTYIDYETNIYGAIGHDISDGSSYINGEIYASEVLSINKSGDEIGNKITTADMNKVYGTVFKTDETGVYGIYQDTYKDKEPIQVAMPKEIKLGKAYIVTSMDNEIRKYEIEITSINMLTKTQNISFKVVDEELIEKTNGIIKGMSGSPIIQNGKLIGALSHSNTYNYLKGNGIFITNMLN